MCTSYIKFKNKWIKLRKWIFITRTKRKWKTFKLFRWRNRCNAKYAETNTVNKLLNKNEDKLIEQLQNILQVLYHELKPEKQNFDHINQT